MFDVFVKSVCAIAAMLFITLVVLGAVGWMQFTSQINTIVSQWQSALTPSAPAPAPSASVSERPCEHLQTTAHMIAKGRFNYEYSYAQARQIMLTRYLPNASAETARPYIAMLEQLYKTDVMTLSPLDFSARYACK
jgi:hypothetical protein